MIIRQAGLRIEESLELVEKMYADIAGFFRLFLFLKLFFLKNKI